VFLRLHLLLLLVFYVVVRVPPLRPRDIDKDELLVYLATVGARHLETIHSGVSTRHIVNAKAKVSPRCELATSLLMSLPRLIVPSMC